ncbi:hypothetical protein [Salegentibacter maritimus]|uniref:DUF4412 domain-containing protein n=1 Tax=Salegentibacter maritimus TaxID=2794347 RepID=A0ABS0TGJ6_9FLAO|nr:hypothetical protein [Salegentibacter maritimus]MBI6120184.1 hypothetical protein [Salegentibacter maritimus]
MKNLLFALLGLAFGFQGIAQEKYLSKEIQIKMAGLAAPEEDRANITVYGYDKEGKVVLLKEGSNNLVCIADDPGMNGISVSCYNKKLEPFMSRGRELKAEGKDMMERRAIRQKEVESGKLKMPDAPSMTYILTGKEANLNRETGELKDAKLRYVIYMPYATTEETGLPDKPHTPGMPWLMDPGTHRAHIMITPADKN